MCQSSIFPSLRIHLRSQPLTRFFRGAILAAIAGASSVAQSDVRPDDAPQASGESDTSNGALTAADGTLSLEQLIGQVIARNPSVDQAMQSLRAASERPEQARALDDPMFSYMLAPGTLGSSQFDVAQKFEVSQSFSWPGKRRLRGEAAHHEAEGLRGEVESVREELAYEARAAFLDLWFLDRALEINAANEQLLAEFEEIAERKYGAGLVSKQDALHAKVEQQMLIHDGAVLRRYRNRATAKINALLNRGTDATVPAPAPFLSNPIAPPALSELQAAAEQQRPELQRMASLVHSAETRTSLARKEFYPDFSIMASYDNYWDEREMKPSVGFSLNLPIQLGRRRAAASEAEAELASAESETRKLRRDIHLEVHEAFEEVQESLEGVTLYESHLLPAAEENLEAARSAYSSGETDFLALVSAQKLLMDTTLRARESQAAYHKGTAKLGRATGSSVADSALTEE